MTSATCCRPRFMLDHMVIRTGKYLRIIGYDADWDLGLRTHELIQRANAAQRVFVTRNRHIADQYPRVRDLFILNGNDPLAQFRTLVRDLHLDTRSWVFSRCIRCNEELAPISDRQAIRDRVHPNVWERHQRFFQCRHCGTILWHGSHVLNTCRKLDLALPRDGDATGTTEPNRTPGPPP